MTCRTPPCQASQDREDNRERTAHSQDIDSPDEQQGAALPGGTPAENTLSLIATVRPYSFPDEAWSMLVLTHQAPSGFWSRLTLELLRTASGAQYLFPTLGRILVYASHRRVGVNVTLGKRVAA